MPTFNLPTGLSDIDQSMGQKGALPFAAPLFWWNNANQELEPLAESQPWAYFGGFVTKLEDLKSVCETRGVPMPAMKSGKKKTRDGKSLELIGTRSMLLVPIMKRVQYRRKGPDGTNEIVYGDTWPKGYSRHAHLLAMLFSKDANGVTPWGPVVLTLGGFQVSNLFDAFTQWQKVTAPLRAALVEKGEMIPPATAFAAPVGNFGDAPTTKMVGRPGLQSPITPIALREEKLTGDQLMTRFIGNDAAAEIMTLREQATPWANEWSAASRAAAPVDEYDGLEDPGRVPEIMQDEDLPF